MSHFSSVPEVVSRALAVLLVKRHRVFVGHIGRAGLQGLHRVDAGTAIFEICPVEFEAFLFLQLEVLLLPSRGFKVDMFQDPLLFRGRESRRPLLAMPAMQASVPRGLSSTTSPDGWGRLTPCAGYDHFLARIYSSDDPVAAATAVCGLNRAS